MMRLVQERGAVKFGLSPEYLKHLEDGAVPERMQDLSQTSRLS